MKPSRQKILPFAILLIVIAVASYLIWSKEESSANGSYSGYAEGELVYVASPLGGQLQSLYFQRGDHATQGQPLFLLERAEESAARSEAEETMRESRTHLDKAKLDFDRAKSLRDKRVIASEDYDTAEQALLSAQHNAFARQRSLEQAQWRYDQKQQSIPTDGLVYDTYYRPGEWVPAGTPVASLLPPEYIKARFFVPEKDLGRIQVGTPVHVHLDGLAKSLPGKVSFVSPSAEYTLPIIYSRENRNKLVFLVEASLPPEAAKQLHPGAPIQVDLVPTESAQ